MNAPLGSDKNTQLRSDLQAKVESAVASGSFQNLDSLSHEDLSDIYFYLGDLDKDLQNQCKTLESQQGRPEEMQAEHRKTYLDILRQRIPIISLLRELRPLATGYTADIYGAQGEAVTLHINVLELQQKAKEMQEKIENTAGDINATIRDIRKRIVT